MEPELSEMDKRILADDVGERTRLKLTDTQCTQLYEVIQKLETDKGSPPTWMQVR